MSKHSWVSVGGYKVFIRILLSNAGKWLAYCCLRSENEALDGPESSDVMRFFLLLVSHCILVSVTIRKFLLNFVCVAVITRKSGHDFFDIDIYRRNFMTLSAV